VEIGNNTLTDSKITKKEVDRFKSVSSSSDDTTNGDDSGFVNSLNNWIGSTIEGTKYITNKFGVLEIGSNLVNTGSALAESGSNLVTKGTEVAVFNCV
jgi:PKD repeat protein